MTNRASAAGHRMTDERASDAALVSAAQAGDRQAFTVLLRRHDAAMRRLAYRMLGDAHSMDDALQEAYVKAFRALATYRDDAQFASWLYRITYNACIDELRRIRRRPIPAAVHPDQRSTGPSPDHVIAVADEVRSALARLPADQRATVLLVDGEGLDHRDAAEVLGVAPGTVASRLSRARASLRHFIKETDE